MTSDVKKNKTIKWKNFSIHLVRYFSIFITIISFYYIANSIFKINTVNLKFINPSLAVVFIALFAIIYSTVVIASAINWKIIIDYLNKDKMPYPLAIRIYTQSNLSKYIPGNIMHYVNRTFLAKAREFQYNKVALSCIIEIVALLLTISLLIVAFLLIGTINLPATLVYNEKMAMTLLSLAVLTIIFALYFFLYKKHIFKKVLSHFCNIDFFFLILKNILINTFSFIITTLLLCLIFTNILYIQILPADILKILAIYITAWFLGFISIASPGGIGVRESVIVILLSPLVTKELALIAAITLRLVVILGEIIAFFISLQLSKKHREEGLGS